MPQPSISYACGRIGVLGRNALKSAHLERLMAAHTYEEALRTLLDIGFLSAEGVDFQTASDQHVLKACQLLRSISPNPQVTDCFLLRYDVHNLKVLLKSRFLAKQPEFLSECGTTSVHLLRHAVTDHSYAQLPEYLKDAMEHLEKELVVNFSPLRIDTELDKAMYRQVFSNLKGKHVFVVENYFRAKVDLQNFIMLIRVKNMGKDARFFDSISLPGGQISVNTFERNFDEPDRLGKMMLRYGTNISQNAMASALSPAQLPVMEKEADDYLYGLFKPFQYTVDSIETLIAYLLQKQREATDVRLILAGKLNNFDSEAVTERVRDLHG